MKITKSQKQHTGKTFLDLFKTVLTVFVVGGLIPNSPITLPYMLWGVVVAIFFYLAAMILLKGEDEDDKHGDDCS